MAGLPPGSPVNHMTLPNNDDSILLLHNSRCSKSRATKELLDERGVAFAERNYLEDPLSGAELEDLAQRLGRPVRDWTRKGESVFSATGLTDTCEERAWLDAIAANPILMERPIVVRGKRAVVGRPPTNALTLLDQ